MNSALNQDTKATIERVTGMMPEGIRDTDSEVLQQRIEKKMGKRLKFNRTVERLMGRGSAYVAPGRFFTFNRPEMGKRIDSISV